MEIRKRCCVVLSNFEVMECLQEMKDTTKKHGLRNLSTITYETLQFLRETPCKHQSAENIAAFLNAVKMYNLTKSECLLLVNEPPKTALHIQLLIEDSEERLTETQVNELIQIANKYLLTTVTE